MTAASSWKSALRALNILGEKREVLFSADQVHGHLTHRNSRLGVSYRRPLLIWSLCHAKLAGSEHLRSRLPVYHPPLRRLLLQWSERDKSRASLNSEAWKVQNIEEIFAEGWSPFDNYSFLLPFFYDSFCNDVNQAVHD